MGQSLTYLLSLWLARWLGVDSFDDFAVAAAVFMLLVSIACLGSEKYALRVLPVFGQRGDWGRMRGYIRFGLQRSIVSSTLLCVAVVVSAVALGDRLQPSARVTIIVAALALPLAAAVHFGLEVLTAIGREFIASALFRILVPAVAFACLLLLDAGRMEPSGVLAVVSWGPAWLLALLLMIVVAVRSVPPPVLSARPIVEAKSWRAEARPFFYYRLSLGLVGHSGLIALSLLKSPATDIGAFAAATATVGLLVVCATATNRAYGRRLSLLLEHRDYLGIMSLRRRRLRWLLPCVLAFLIACVVFGRELMTLFSPDFADQGTYALMLLATGASLAVLLALAPMYLKYQRRKRTTYVIMAGAALLQGMCLWLLVPPFGATGAAAAYLVSMGAMYGSFAGLAHRELVALRGS